SDVWQHVHDSSAGEVALNYGERGPLFYKLGIWMPILGRSFLSPALAWASFVAILVASSISCRNYFRLKRAIHIQPIIVIAALQILFLLCIFAINITVDSRYTYAMLPCIAVLFMKLC